PPAATLFPSTTLFRSHPPAVPVAAWRCRACGAANRGYAAFCIGCGEPAAGDDDQGLAPPGPEHESRGARWVPVGVALAVGLGLRSEEHTSELQSRGHL